MNVFQDTTSLGRKQLSFICLVQIANSFQLPFHRRLKKKKKESINHRRNHLTQTEASEKQISTQLLMWLFLENGYEGTKQLLDYYKWLIE